MKIRFFDFAKDYAKISEWYKAWGAEAPPAELLPKHGLIVNNEGHDVCGAFLYVTDGGLGLFEGAVMDPLAPKKRRKGTLTFLNRCLQELAKQVGCKMVMIISKDKYITNLSKDLGFECLEPDFKVLKKRL